MARDTSGLSPNNVFKPASTTIDASIIYAAQLSTYSTLLGALSQPAVNEALRENDLSQIKTLQQALVNQLTTWLALVNS